MKAADIIKHLAVRTLIVNTPDHQDGIMLQLVNLEHLESHSKDYPAFTTLIRGRVEPVDHDLRHHDHLNKYFRFAVFEDKINKDNLEALLMDCANDVRKAYTLPLVAENPHENPTQLKHQ